MVKKIALASLLILAACQTATVDGDFCYRNEPIRPSAEAIQALSDEDVQRILEHNKRGEALCGWKP